jgi:hypothetical protein
MRSSYALAISARSRQLAAGRTAGGGYANHGERMYVEGVLEQRRKEQLVRLCCFMKTVGNPPHAPTCTY